MTMMISMRRAAFLMKRITNAPRFIYKHNSLGMEKCKVVENSYKASPAVISMFDKPEVIGVLLLRWRRTIY